MIERAGRSRHLFRVLMVTAALGIGVLPAAAESLNEALASAYSANPTLRAARASQRGNDELVPQALSGWRPTVTAHAQAGIQTTNNNYFHGSFFNPVSNDPSTRSTGTFQIILNQPVFDGLLTPNSVKSGEANVEAGRQNLLATEQDVLFQAAQAYMDVVRDRQIVTLRQRNVEVLREQLKAAEERFNVGEVTKTDVAQARARLSGAQAQVSAAKAQLAQSVASYEKIIGHAPGSLKYPRIAALPANLDSAIATAGRINPVVLRAAFQAEAARHDIGVAEAGLLPDLSMQASVQRDYPDLQKEENQDTYSVFGILSIPLYESGKVYSGVRQAKQVASERRIQIIESQRSVRELVVSSWNFLESARQQIVADHSTVAADELALEGVKQEYLVGSRTTLDVLDAEAELLLAREQLVRDEHDQVVAAYQLIAATGKLTAQDLALGVDLYDPVQNYRKVRNKWGGTHADTVD